jgi:hypothetical protein
MATPAHRAAEYRRKAEKCRLQSNAAKHHEVTESWRKLAAQWERLAEEIDSTTSQQAQQPQTKERP